MPDNPVKDKLKRGERVYGTMLFEFATPGFAAIAAAAGAEFLLLDMEHSGLGLDTIKSQLAYARGLDLVPIVRVPGPQYQMIAPVLDAGAKGIMVPMVESAETARAIVAATRYPPAGVRGAAFGVAHDDYRPGAVADKIARANAQTIVIAMIETAKGVDQVEQIAAVDGVDLLWLGHFDLTNSLGIPGQFEHPRFQAAVDRLLAAANAAGKPVGYMGSTVANARTFLDRGFRAIAYSGDIWLLQDALASGLRQLRNA
jgi:2-dehydro-3-deoxyglucarate aldolase/4-hydroxy-2-oxoheptanedioate aldolase